MAVNHEILVRAEALGRSGFKAQDLMNQSKHWSEEELEGGLKLLYEADGWLKSGSRPKPVLEEVIISLCGRGGISEIS